MLALRTSPPVFTTAEAEGIARDTYGLAVSAQVLPGERDCNFRLRGADHHEYVLKIYGTGVATSAAPGVTASAAPGAAYASSALAVDCQVRVLAHLAEQDAALPVPRVVPTESGDEIGRTERGGERHALCLFGYLPGRLLAAEQPSPELLTTVGMTLARVDRALRGFFHPALAQDLAWDVRNLPALAEFAEFVPDEHLRKRVTGVAETLRTLLPTMRGLRSQAIHGDCHGGNLLIDPRTQAVSGVLDFGDMLHAPLILEPAVAMAESMTGGAAGEDAPAALLRGFAAAEPLSATEVDLLFELITARQAVSVLLHAWRSQHDPAGARLVAEEAAGAGASLGRLLDGRRASLTQAWHGAAGTGANAGAKLPAATVTVARRHRLLGAGAELFYDRPLHLVRAHGVWLYDAADRPYLDVYNNVPHVGHTHPTVVDAVQRQTAILSTHTRYLHAGVLDYAERLTGTLPGHLNACIFVNSGSEANDVAWRMAQLITGHKGALVMTNAYHGVTDAVAALTPASGAAPHPRVVTLQTPPVEVQVDDVPTFDALNAVRNDTERAIARLAARGLGPAAFFIDTALTSSGIFDPPASWSAAIASRVRAAGGIVVADEVQYGLGRSGSHFWGFERRGLLPDIVTLGKPVGNGYPLGVVIASREAVEAFQANYGFFSTFGGNPVAAAAGLAVLEVLAHEGLMANAERSGAYLRERLESIAVRHRCLGRVRGVGLLMGLEVRGADAAEARRRTRAIVNRLAVESRILIGSEGPLADILKLRPPMPFAAAHVDLLVEGIDAAATAVERDL